MLRNNYLVYLASFVFSTAAKFPLLVRLSVVLFASCLLSACQETEIAHDLSQRQANEIITVLSEQGISSQAVRAAGSRAQFLVQVPANRYTEAIAILHYEGLPKLEEPTLNELLSPKGFLPNSRELEDMRVDRIVAAELEAMLKTNPAINEVKAIVQRTVFEGVGPQPPAHVSLIIRKLPETSISKESILELVSNLVSGASNDSIIVDIQDALPLSSTLRQGMQRSTSSGKVVSVPMKEFLGWWRVAENDYDRMILVLLIAVIAFLVVGLFVGFSVGFLGRKVVSAKPLENFAALKGERSTLTLSSPE